MLHTRVDAELRYEKLRKLALQHAQEGASDEIRLDTITPTALQATQVWNRSEIRQVDWDWVEGYSHFKFRYPKRFEVAIWKQSDLLSLSMGRPTYRGSALRLDFVEARPRDLGDRPGLFNEVLIAYGVYARMINAKQIRIMNPINEGVKAYYERFGFSYVSKHDYLYREVL